jgi:chloride channel 3/4/5
MDLVYECFVKLGLRYICVLRDGRYAGMVSYFSPLFFLSLCLGVKKWVSGWMDLANDWFQTHKKTFVKYMRELEEKEGHM